MKNKDEIFELRMIVKEFERIVPIVHERLKTYSANSHPSSPSDKALWAFESALEQVAKIKRFGVPVSSPNNTNGTQDDKVSAGDKK